MKNITIGLIGIGDILTSHLDGLRANPDFELVGVSRRSEEKLRRQAGELGCRGFADYRDLLAEGPDVVLISLPHGLHCEVAVEAIEAGSHVVVEKPLAVSVAECNRILEAAAKHDKRLVVAESASFIPGAMLTGRKFVAGELGQFLTGSIVNERFYFHDARPKWFLDPAMSGGGMFSNVGVHRLAVARACLPGLAPVAVSASVCHVPEYPVEACTSAIVKYKEGGSMLYEEVGYFPKPEWLNTGTHFVFENGIVAWDDKIWRMMKRNGEQIDEPLAPAGPGYAHVYANMLHAIRNERYAPHAWECAVDVAIVQAAYASSRSGQQIDLTSPDWLVVKK